MLQFNNNNHILIEADLKSVLTYEIRYSSIIKSILNIVFNYMSLEDTLNIIKQLVQNYIKFYTVTDKFHLNNCHIDNNVINVINNYIENGIFNDNSIQIEYKIHSDIYNTFLSTIFTNFKRIINEINNNNNNYIDILKNDINIVIILRYLYYNNNFQITSNLPNYISVLVALCNKINSFWKETILFIQESNKEEEEEKENIYNLFRILNILLLSVYKIIDTNGITVTVLFLKSFSTLIKNIQTLQIRFKRNDDIEELLVYCLQQNKDNKIITPSPIKRKQYKGRNHSRNPVLDELLEEESGSDGFADLEDFIAYGSDIE